MAKLDQIDVRIPQWDFNDLYPRCCPFCEKASGDIFAERPDGLMVRNCPSCDALFVSPAPSESQLATFYADYDRNHRRSPSMSLSEIVDYYQGIDPYTDLKIRELATLKEMHGTTVLDVGSGRGQFLHAMRVLGALPHGVDPDDSAVKIGQQMGIPMYHSISEVDRSARFDIVSMIDLIEHPLDPLDLLVQACEMLSQHGLLLLWTPNADAPRRSVEMTTLRVDLEHMQYLSPITCQFIAKRLGLQIIHLETLGFPALEGIDQPIKKSQSIFEIARGLLRSAPGFRILREVKKSMSMFGSASPQSDERLGDYCLFCIMTRHHMSCENKQSNKEQK